MQRLQRDLRDTAAACRDNPAACAKQLRDRGQSLPRMQQEARGSEARRRLAEAIAQLRERLQRAGRDGQSDSPEQRRQHQAQRRFSRAAGGQPGQPGGKMIGGAPEGEGEESDDEASGDVGDGPESASSGGESAGSAGETAGQGASDGDQGGGRSQSATAEGTASGGDGIGNEIGGAPLGRTKDQGAARGREREAAVRSHAGPKRSQVIEAAAARGFAHGDYRRVYQDYGAVVEESLDATAVPPGQRYLVRRYFQLIRPRAATAPAAAPRGGP